MTDKTTKLGVAGEAVAVSFLKSSGFCILETNFRTRSCEIDIIAEEKNTLCFIEVKTRSSLKKGLPKESITPAKQYKIIQGAQYYLKKNPSAPPRPIRFDVVEVFIKAGRSGTPQINLIKNAFPAA